MAGIYGSFLKKSTNKKIYKKFYNANFPFTKSEEIEYNGFVLGRSVLNKFQNDRFLFENESFIVCYEGINYSHVRKPIDFISAYQIKGSDFVKDLKGNFSGFVFDKAQNQILIFTDPLSTKQIYYFFDKNLGFAFTSEMHVLTQLLKSSQISLQPDKDGVYCLALYGQLFDGKTIINQIHKLNYGSILKVNFLENKIKESSYYKFTKKQENISIEDSIEGLDQRMTEAISNEWEKDREYNYQHICLLSGGLDSRVNSMISKELGFKNTHVYTYGNPRSTDIKIAQQIAGDNFHSHAQHNFVNGNHLHRNVMENYIKGAEGRIIFAALSMVYNAIKHINPQSYGILHSGQIGDVVSGSFVKPGFDFKKNKDRLGITAFIKNPKLLDKIGFLNDFLDRYEGTDHEIFAYEQGIVNGTFYGDHIANNFIDLAAPFYNKDLIDFCLNIPNEYKTNQWIYTKWMQKKHPKLVEYPWEKIGLKPNSDFNVKYGRFYRKYLNGGKKYLGLKYDSMNPITTWIRQNPEILQTFDRLFAENIDLIEDAELKKDLSDIYRADVFEYRNKFSVLTTLLGIRLHLHNY